MAHHHEETVVQRPDGDVIRDVHRVFNIYPPLQHDRARVTVSVEDGAVTAAGHVKTAQAREIFVREAAKVDGVTEVDVSALYDDETLRLASGMATPLEVYTSVSYGAVMLTGRVPEDWTLEKVIAAVEKIPGVRKVIPNFPK